MDSRTRFILGLYLAWGALLIATSFVQKGPRGRKSCLLGAAGFGILAANVFVPSVTLNWTLIIVALGMLVVAAVGTFKVSSDATE